MDSGILQGVAGATMLAILAVGGMQMQVSPNLWVMVNTLQILRTILLLKINLPDGIRQTIEASSLFAQFDFGITSRVMTDPSSPESIMTIMNGDELLGDYFEQYGIETYRFIDYVASIFFDCLLLFVVSTIGVTLLSAIYLKIRKRSMKPIKQKLYHVFVLNGLIRIYMEILLDGLLYIFVNLRAMKFINTIDAFSYIFLFVFLGFVIFSIVFFVIYTKKVNISKWSGKIEELLSETNMKKPGVLMYHLIFCLRR